MISNGNQVQRKGFPEQEALESNVNVVEHAGKDWRDQDLDIILLENRVTGETLPLEVGVDRHLGPTPSSDGSDVVNCHLAPAGSQMF
jgi:hypothetical protein